MNTAASTKPQAAPPSDESATYANELIRASAGTGKTFHLSNRYLRLVLNDVPVTEILATTFTRQAAREILDRILFRLAVAAETDDAACDLAVALEMEDNFVSSDSSFREKCLRKLRELTSALPRLRVSTLDAFFAQIAQSFSLEIGLPPGWRIAEETDEAIIRAQAIDRYLGNGKPERVVKLMHLLSKGKAERSVSRMIADTVIDLHGLYLDSDSKAWKRLAQIKMLDDVALEEAINALNDCEMDQYDVIKSIKNAKQKDCDRAVAGQWDAFLISGIAGNLARGMRTFGNGKKNEIPESLAALYEPLITHSRAILRNQVSVQTESTYTLLEGFDSQYQMLKDESRSLRFDDVNRSLLPFAKNDAFRQIAFRMNGQVNHLLLDEFQDTSLDQWRVIRPFASHVATGNRRSFFCVGDVKQAIYGWRGGSADILDQMDQQLPDLAALELSDSYRSSSIVIDFVNQVNQNIVKHPSLSADEENAAREWSNGFPKHATARKELAGHVTVETATRPESDDETLLDSVLDHCADRVADVVRQCPAATVAVLTRSNDAVGKLIFRLQKLGIGASELGGNPLTDSAAVQLILSRLRLADHPGDTAAFFHLQNSPWANELGICEPDANALFLSEQTRRDLANYGYGTTIEGWAKLLRPYCNAREWRRLRQLVEMAFIYQRQSEKPAQLGFTAQRRVSHRTRSFINRVETERVADPSTNQVSVMTVHKSKGLQFDAVFVVELDKHKPQTPKCLASRRSPFDAIDAVTRYVPAKLLEQFPSNVQRLHHDAVQKQFREDLCVMYVALTRAIHALHLIIEPSKPTAKSGNVPKTAAGIIRAAIEATDDLSESAVVYECGDSSWIRDVNAKTKTPVSLASDSNTESSENVARRPQVKLRPASVNTVPDLSPSSREGGGRVRLANRLSLDSSAAMLFGTVMHAWFEQIEWIEDFDVDVQKENLHRIARQLDFPSAAVGEAWRRFCLALGEPKIRELLSKSGVEAWLRRDAQIQSQPIDHIVVRNEQPISAEVDGKTTSGFVDRLVFAADKTGIPLAAQIVDYKTDAMRSNDPTLVCEKAQFYRPQLKAYRNALSEMTRLPLENISCCLVFVNLGLVKNVL